MRVRVVAAVCVMCCCLFLVLCVFVAVVCVWCCLNVSLFVFLLFGCDGVVDCVWCCCRLLV